MGQQIQQYKVMIAEREFAVHYRITVSNITTIGNKFMSDFYISFNNNQNGYSWKSPLVHGRVTEESKDYPWTFLADSSNLMINFHQIKETNQDQVIGYSPLLLLKKEGEEQFLIFGCKQNNQGRKVAEVQFQYSQESIAQSVISNKNAFKYKDSSDSNQRVSLDYTMEIQNFNQNDGKNQYANEKHKSNGLGTIPQQTQLYKESQMARKTHKQQLQEINDNNIDTLTQDYVISPSKLNTLRGQTQRIRNMGDDSTVQFNILKEIEDTTDRWYRNKFGKNKPGSPQQYDFQCNDTSRVLPIFYDKSYEYLNNSDLKIPHVQLRNVVVNSQKKAMKLELFNVDFESSKIKNQRIAFTQTKNGYRREWNGLIRLPSRKKAFALQLMTVDQQKLQALILRDPNFFKNKSELFDQQGKNVGFITFSMREVKKIQIQTIQMMPEMEAPQEKTNKLDKSFIKNLYMQDSELSTAPALLNSPYFRNRSPFLASHQSSIQSNQPSKIQVKIPSKLKNQAYLGLLSKITNSVNQKNNLKFISPKKQISNQAYMNKRNSSPQIKKIGSFRRNKYQITDSLAKQQNNQQSKRINNRNITSQDQQQNQSFNSKNQFLKQQSNVHLISLTTSNNKQQIFSQQNSSIHLKSDSEPVENSELNNKIDLIKQMGKDLSKNLKVYPSKRMNKNVRYKTIIYDQQNDQKINTFEQQQERKSRSNRSSQQGQVHQKAYRTPINVTAKFNEIPPNDDTVIKIQVNKPRSNKKGFSKPKEFLNNDDLKMIKPTKITKEELFEGNNKQKIQKPVETLPQQTKIANNSDIQENTPIKKPSNKYIFKKNDHFPISTKNNSQQPNEQQTVRSNKLSAQLGINTERMKIVQNILHSSYIPMTTTHKKASQQKRKSGDWTGEQDDKGGSLKQQMGSFLDSVLIDNHQPKTKYSAQTLQPVNYERKSMGFSITNLSVSCYQSVFGSKYVKLIIPKKYHYVTESSSNSLFWKLKGLAFSQVKLNDDLYVQLFNNNGTDQELIGRAIISCEQFGTGEESKTIRVYLTLNNRVIGEAVLGYNSLQYITNNIEKEIKKQAIQQHKSLQSKQVNGKTSLSKKKQERKSEEKNKTSLKKKKKKKGKGSADDLAAFLRLSKKLKISRFQINECSRANIQSRINPIRQKKYKAGKNIVIGKDLRFPLRVQQEHFMEVPGPGSYEQRSEFQRYCKRHQPLQN